MKYPIKYAVMEVREKGGAIIDYDPIVAGYIVSKCYVCEEITKHMGDGSSRVEYKVVFPFHNYKLFKDCHDCNIEYDIKPEIPQYDKEKKLLKYTVVSDLYDTYDEAKESANNYNTKLLLDLIESIKRYGNVFKCQFLLFEREFYRDLNKCLKFETKINQLTDDMQISKDDKIIKLLK